MPLDGRVLIEASAGTGKTFTIGLIFLRLLLERGLRVEQIVVATFSERAARELRDRLRRRLLDAERALDGDAELDDPAMQSWFEQFRRDGARRKRALREVRIARADMDRAPIGTIHSWCQRVLRDFPLESGASLGTAAIVDETGLLRECLEDFWRRRFLTSAVSDDLDGVIAQGVDGLIHDVQSLFTTDARVLPLSDDVALAALVEQLRHPRHVAVLCEWAADVSLFKRSDSALRSRFTKLVMAAEGRNAIAILQDCACIDADQIDGQLKPPGLRICTHETFVLIREARSLAAEVDVQRHARARVLIAALEFCGEEVPRRAQCRDVKTYGMLIDGVHARLAGSSGDAFAKTLFDTFPAALIDEFQDTDRRQFEIFDRIYRQRGFLAMIGDPKQAIYAFRGGDIAAYLAARETADRHFALTVNYRSSSPLLASFNALYARTDGGFGSEAIRYRDVTAGGKADSKPLRRGIDVENKPFSLHCFAADDGEKGVMKLDERVLDDCAERIVELLNDRNVSIDGKRVAPGDIAVLVTKNDHVAELRRRLTRRGVPCVGAGRDSVFRSSIARDLELVLYGVANAADERAVRGALCTELLGFTLDDVRRWQADGAAFESELLRFEAWRELARTRGVQALVHAIAAERAGAVLAREDGERLLTDLRHLGELLAEDAQVSQGLESACVRLSSLRNSDDTDEEETMKSRLVRIESDAARVKLMTVHAAKGLQFPIVFLPFAWRPRSKMSPILRFHDENGARCVDLGSAQYSANRARAQAEEMQERLRLLYVALTRAQYAVHVYWAETKNGRDGTGASALGSLLHQILGDDDVAQMSACDGMRVIGPHAGGFHSYKTDEGIDETLAPRRPLPAPRPFVWLHSFSSLTRRAALATAESAASDEIETAADALLEAAAESAAQVVDDPTLLSLDAWRGRHFGNSLHAILEEAEPGPLWPDQRKLLHRHLAALGTREGRSVEAVGRMAQRVRSTDLGDGLRLDTLDVRARVVEFEFQFPVGVRADALRDICTAHGFRDLIPSSLADSAIAGMLTGFADLVFAHGGRFHVLDYKTNWLGNRRTDYAPAPLHAAMDEHHYGLQALLYTVALHRYLRDRLDDYAPERHLGESWYLFVRAVGLGDGLGVWRRQWPSALVEELDAAFAGEREAA
jgi:exodeoxyribonuclease V beta subunit